jgi:hypothetical protein
MNDRKATRDSFTLKVKVYSGSAPAHLQILMYQCPHKWRSETFLLDASSVNVRLCNGNVAWAYEALRGKADNIRRWNVEELVKAVGDDLTYVQLQAEGFDGIIMPANPDVEQWKKEFSHQKHGVKLSRIGEEKIGKQDVVRFETLDKDEPKFHIWFGKKDGLLKRQVLYGGGGVEKIHWEVEGVDTQPKFDDSSFNYRPLPTDRIMDSTNDLIEEAKAALDRLNKKPRPR